MGSSAHLAGPALPVGNQYPYRTVFDGLRSIARKEGMRGLLRGADAAALRTAFGSSVQLPSYGVAKRQLLAWGFSDGLPVYFLASSFSGVCVLLAMQPTDTVLTRMYSQSADAIGPNASSVLCLR